MFKTKKQKQFLKIFAALAFAEILWGANRPVIKLGLETIPPMLYLAITVGGAALLILPFALKKWKRLSQKDYTVLIVASIISITIGNMALYMGLQRVPAVNASLIGLFGPLLLFIMSVGFLKERMGLKTLVGVLVAFTGAAVIVGKPWDASGAAGQEAVIGNFMLILAVLCEIIGLLLCKPILKKAGTNQVTFIYMMVGIVPLALFSLKDLPALAPSVAGQNGYTAIAFNIIAITIANMLFMYGLKQKKLQEIGVFVYLNPLTTLVVAWILLSETPTPKIAIGALLIFIGIYLAEFHTPKHKLHVAAVKIRS